MKQIIIPVILIIFFILNFCKYSSAQNIRIPAEWEKQERIFLGWFNSERRDSVTCRVIQYLHKDINITINITEDTLQKSILNKLEKYNINLSKISFNTDPFADFWIRDLVTFTVKNDKLNIVCFNFNLYGIYPYLINEKIPDEIIKMGLFDESLANNLNTGIIRSDFVFEAGGIESNGNGTLMLIKEMAVQRNPEKSLPEIETELKEKLGAVNFIWLKGGLVEDITFKNYGPFYKNYFGGGANRHIDELCRFIDEQTVVLPFIPESERFSNPVDSINYQMFEDNFEILRNTELPGGKKLTIYRLPVPESEELKIPRIVSDRNESEFKEFGFSAGDTIYQVPAASYMNFFISNNTVLIPKYWLPGMSDKQKTKDDEVLKFFNDKFPEKNVYQIYTISINRGGGGLHCMILEMPEVPR